MGADVSQSDYNLDVAASAYAWSATWWWQWRRRRSVKLAYMKGAVDMNHAMLRTLFPEIKKVVDNAAINQEKST